jgi:hypothetical protein
VPEQAANLFILVDSRANSFLRLSRQCLFQAACPRHWLACFAGSVRFNDAMSFTT